MIAQLKQFLQSLRDNPEFSETAYRKGNALYINGQCQLMTQSRDQFEFSLDDEFGDFGLILFVNEEGVFFESKDTDTPAVEHIVASVLQLIDVLDKLKELPSATGKAYTREGMIKRVLAERRERASRANYHVDFATNPYGEHILITEKGGQYKITFRDLEQETGYCSCKDYRTNKLGTCKHLIFAYSKKKGGKSKLKKPRKPYPFVDVFLDPLNGYQISWFHPDAPKEEVSDLLKSYFDENQVLPKDKKLNFLKFVQQAEEMKQILIRPEVHEVIEKSFDQAMMDQIKNSRSIDLSEIKADLFPYQKEGVEFAAFREGVIIADEMGLGKTLQAIAVSIVKKRLFGFTKTLVICPASLKNQWKLEIEKFSDEKAVVVEGFPDVRHRMYHEAEAYFFIINYETVLRDQQEINKADFDFIILDEAQRIKNYETRTAQAVKSLQKRHALVITGTPIENRLIDLFSIMDFLDPYFLSPLWEFSYQYCFFDTEKKNKITGYFNLQELKSRLSNILIRREKREVIQDLPNLTEIDVPVGMHEVQLDYHTSFAQGVGAILRKKFMTPYDMNRLMMLLNQMRMACDSSYLIDKETFHSPKLEELKHILIEKIDIHQSERKVLIFSEWVRMNALIGKMLREHNIGFVELNGKVPIPKRQNIVNTFQQNSDCKVFLSTEAGGAGLNLQAADTVINFELPWNPAKKNQRIGRIDRLGQQNKHLTVINLITKDSFEMRIATGLLLKQNLFDSVLNSSVEQDIVDFSSEGRAQFLKQLEMAIEGFVDPEPGPSTVENQEIQEQISDIEAVVREPEEADSTNNSTIPTSSEHISPSKEVNQDALGQVEQVMNQGMGFLAGLFKMATGNELALEDQKIEVDRQTGEVVMRFKMPIQNLS